MGFCSDGSLAELKNTPFSSLMNRFTISTQQQKINSKINQYTLKDLNDIDPNVKGEFLVFLFTLYFESTREELIDPD